MPRISDARRDERRSQYLDATRRCVSRLGVAATRMEDITAEAGLSSGSTYLYFESKNALIRAAIDESLSQFEELVATVDRTAGPDAAACGASLLAAAGEFRHTAPGVDLFRLAVQGWAFAQTDAESARRLQESAARITSSLEGALGARLAGASAHDVRSAARGLFSVLVGGIVRSALLAADGTPSTAAELAALTRWLG